MLIILSPDFKKNMKDMLFVSQLNINAGTNDTNSTH